MLAQLALIAQYACLVGRLVYCIAALVRIESGSPDPTSPSTESHNAQRNGWTRAVKLTKNLVKVGTTASLHPRADSKAWPECRKEPGCKDPQRIMP